MATLFEITQELIDLEQQLAECPETAVDEIDAYLAAIEQTEQLRTQKLDNYAALITEVRRRAEARSEEARRLSNLAASDNKLADQLQERLTHYFQSQGLKKVETNRFRLTLAKAGGKPPLIVDESEILNWPDEFKITKTTIIPDKVAIRNAIDAGTEIPFATYGERSESVRIR